ncbi:MAG: rod shape-determining protein MreC [Clostridia bacterium]
MRRLLKNKRFWIIIGICLVLLAVAFATTGSRSVTWVESAIGSVVQPVQSFAATASDSIINFFNRVFKTTDVDKENRQLKVKIAQLEQMETDLEMEKQENQRLKELLKYVETNSEYDYVTAKVIAMNPGIWFDVFTINAGRNDGIEEDMPVVNASGLIGRVTDVGATWSKVTTIIDSRSDVSVMVERTRDKGMVRGLLDSDNENELELYFLPAGSDIVPGDRLVTNDVGGVFPKGIVVGNVTEVMRQTEGAQTRDALIVPAVDFLHIEEVLVLTSTEKRSE